MWPVSFLMPLEDGPAAAKMIEARAGDPNFGQVLLLTRTAEPLGQRRYWPIYQAAEAVGAAGGHPRVRLRRHGSDLGRLAVVLHRGHGRPRTVPQAVLTSLVFEGVFERLPNLKFVLIEGGFAWLPPLLGGSTSCGAELHKEAPHLKRLPSEYIAACLAHHAADGGARAPRASRMRSSGWAGIGYCSPLTTHTGTTTIRRTHCRYG